MNKMSLKLLIFLPMVFFADWILMALIGCVAGLCKAPDKFFCTVYCYFGISLLLVTFGITIFYFLRKRNPA